LHNDRLEFYKFSFRYKDTCRLSLIDGAKATFFGGACDNHAEVVFSPDYADAEVVFLPDYADFTD
jgi:hypothetical protein